MAERAAQTYATHVHRPRLTGVAAIFALAAAILFVVYAVRQPGVLALGAISLTVAVFVLIAISRVYIVRLQDRIIRLEMMIRMERLGVGAEFARLRMPQVVALRFAADAELPALARRALVENLTSRQIKEAIRDWQGDYLRT